ncbi:MAG: 1-deoxy-D-xylulose-5-phosphate reductoisomerase [Gammaproteobacteria bacterium]|nr:1-deoxy-D-xylulose-5-phosphate reductoisomerase [Gammaproteobacteria bacterium]
MTQGITVLGATGSIGMSTLDVLRRHQDRFRVVALSGNSRLDRLLEQCIEFQPSYVSVADERSAESLDIELQRHGLHTIRIVTGVEGLELISGLPQISHVMAAIVGAAGLRPALAAARAGKTILLANKEALVMSGQIFMDIAQRHGAKLLPIDSEHNAIFQCMPPVHEQAINWRSLGVKKILLTASGGPFRKTPLEELRFMSPAQAVAHPNWSMGRKISVDSASMMNKGLEVIEACWLFNCTPDQIEVVVHPQSIIHSMVEYIDGSVLAQLGNPDMRTPIAHALAWPERIVSGVGSLDLFAVAKLDFERADFNRYPCLRLAMDAMRAGGIATAVLNAANEIAVQAFLMEQIGFTDIPSVIEERLARMPSSPSDSLEAIFKADEWARSDAQQHVARLMN